MNRLTVFFKLTATDNSNISSLQTRQEYTYVYLLTVPWYVESWQLVTETATQMAGDKKLLKNEHEILRMTPRCESQLLLTKCLELRASWQCQWSKKIMWWNHEILCCCRPIFSFDLLLLAYTDSNFMQNNCNWNWKIRTEITVWLCQLTPRCFRLVAHRTAATPVQNILKLRM